MKYNQKIAFFLACTGLVAHVFLSNKVIAGEINVASTKQKAILVSKLIAYTQWPNNEQSIEPAPYFNFCTFKNMPLAKEIQNIYKLNNIKIKQKLKVRNKNYIKESEHCHLIYLSDISDKDLLAILALHEQQPTLLIGENVGFAEKGIHFNLFFENQKIGFEINDHALKLSRLKPDYQLLNYGRLVKGGQF